jgi:hypothetical protein
MAAPLGNKNATKNKPFADAINRAITQDDGKRLRAIAEALLTKAAEGDISAIKEFGDRVDGKVVQALEGTGADGEFITKMVVEFVETDGSQGSVPD